MHPNKLTKRSDQLMPIMKFDDLILDLVTYPDAWSSV